MAEQATPGLKPVSQLKTAADLSRKLDSLRKARQPQEKEWRLNLAFYKGNQYAQWNPHLNRGGGGITTLPTEDGEKPRYRVRIVSNQIVIGVQSLISKLVKSKPMWNATPEKPGDQAVKAAEAAEELLESWWHSLELGSKLIEALIWAQIASNGYWVACWDKFADKAMRYMAAPDGSPITDDGLEAEFRAQLSEAGIDPKQFERVTYMGDVKVECMSPMDVFGDNTAKSYQDWKWVFVRYWLTPDEITARWPKTGKDVKPDSVPMGFDTPWNSWGRESSSDPIVKAVWCGYFLPTPAMPDGRIVWFVEDPDLVLADDPWVFPIRMLPVFQYQGLRVPGSADNEAILTHVRPLQKQLNRLLSQVVEYTNMVIKPRVWAPVNSLRQRLTTEPGAVYEYNPVGNFKPEIEQLPSIPPYVFEFINDIGGRIREMFGLTEVTEGQLPPNLEAANAIDLLQEMAADRFGPMIEENERTIARAGTFLLALAQAYYDEPRMMQVQGLGGSTAVKAFTKADIAGGMTVRVESGSSLPRSRAGRRMQIERWIEMGLIRPERAWKYYDIADVKDLALQFKLDEDHALREHDKMIEGVPLNPEALQQAMAAINRGMNPETGQPLMDPQTGQMTADPQELLQRAALQPYLAEDMTVHMEKHADFIKSMEFDSLQPDVRQRFLTHYEITLTTWRSLPQIAAPKEAPRVTLQLRESVGASTVASVLKRAGVPDADAQTLATEPPMENMVSDSVDKPDADAGGGGMEANQLTQAAQTMLAADAANAQSQQQLAHTHAAHTLDQIQGHQKAIQDAELHSHAVRKAAAEADLAEKKAKESSFKQQPKPKPTNGKK